MPGKIRLTKIFEFAAAHSLPDHEGKCAGIHGHTYRLEVSVEGVPQDAPGTSSHGMVVDYYDLKKIVEGQIINKVDHKYLNEVFPFRTTVENLALKFWEILQEAGNESGLSFTKIKLWESPTSYCEVGDY